MQLVDIEGLGELRLVRYAGSESVSDAFEFEVVVYSDDPDIVLADVVGKSVHLKFGVRQDRLRFVHGIVKRFEHVQDGAQGASYRLLMVPEAWRLKLRTNSRIFQEMTAIDIISKVLDDAGFCAYQLAISSNYAPREYCVQYRESDWNFINRLMEEEGIFFFFEHNNDSCKMVVSDARSVHDPLPVESTLKYRGATGVLGANNDGIQDIQFGEELRSGKVTLRDYNFKSPTVSLEKSSAASLDDDLEIYEYPGNYADGGAGGQRAGVLLEAHQARRRTGHGNSNCSLMSAGRTFTLEDSPRADFNIELLITRVEHRGSAQTTNAGVNDETDVYRNQFEMIPATVPFRALPNTPRPTINGIQTAIVTGPAGEEIHTDEHGRIKVQFHWDRNGKADEYSSCWVRVKQVWAGPGWGSVWIPRIGMEAIIDFIEGDPNRPLCTGTVYHGQNVPPYKLPDDKTKSTLKSNSSVGGDGFNELRFEDQKGSEEIYLHGQKDWNVKVLHDKAQLISHDEALDVGHDQMIHVAHDRSKEVDNDQSEVIGGNKAIRVQKNHTESIRGDETITVSGHESVTIEKTREAMVSQDDTLSIGGNRTLKVSKNLSEDVGGSMAEIVGGARSVSVSESNRLEVQQDASTMVSKSYDLDVGKNMTVKVAKNRDDQVLDKYTIVAGKRWALQCGKATVKVEKNGNISIIGKDITIKGSGALKVEGKKLDIKSKGAVNLKASGKINVKGSSVGVN